MKEEYYLDIVVRREKLDDGTLVFVSTCPTLGIATQGNSIEDSISMIKEAIELYLEESKDANEDLEIAKESFPILTILCLEIDEGKISFK